MLQNEYRCAPLGGYIILADDLADGGQRQPARLAAVLALQSGYDERTPERRVEDYGVFKHRQSEASGQQHARDYKHECDYLRNDAEARHKCRQYHARKADDEQRERNGVVRAAPPCGNIGQILCFFLGFILLRDLRLKLR